MGCHFPHGITMLLAIQHKCTHLILTPDRLVLNTHTPEGWKADLTYVTDWSYTKMFYSHTDIHQKTQQYMDKAWGYFQHLIWETFHTCWTQV